ncbi:MAG: hypothetical protein AB7G75_03350 [Candidatus Binatia bacterium]
MSRKPLLIIITVLWCWGMVGNVSWAEPDAKQESLRGLKGIGVVIEPLQPETEQDGLTQSLIRTDVELALRQAGIHVLSQEESVSEPGSPYLYINLNTVKSEVLYAFTSYLYSLQVSFRQEVTLTRDPQIRVSAATWQSGVLGSISASNLQNLRKTIRDSLDQFINDYLAANPK